jgi:hypothetical protein
VPNFVYILCLCPILFCEETKQLLPATRDSCGLSELIFVPFLLIWNVRMNVSYEFIYNHMKHLFVPSSSWFFHYYYDLYVYRSHVCPLLTCASTPAGVWRQKRLLACGGRRYVYANIRLFYITYTRIYAYYYITYTRCQEWLRVLVCNTYAYIRG